MIPLIGVTVIFLFFYYAHKFANQETIKAVQREIKNEIKQGISVRLSDGRIVYTDNISTEDKRMTSEYAFLKKRGINFEHMDNLNFEELKEKFKIEKQKERIEEAEKRKIERKKLEEARKRQKEEEQRKMAIRAAEDKAKKWELALKHCEPFLFDSRSEVAGVYLIHSMNTNDFYIGSSKNLYMRKRQHISSLKNNKHYSYKMQNDFVEYGIDNFVFYLLSEIKTSEYSNLTQRIERIEQQFIDLLKPSYNYWQNVKDGKKYNLRRNNF